MEPENQAIICEITAANASLRSSLKRIAQTCAIDLGLDQPLNTIEKATGRSSTGASVTLSIAAPAALLNDSIWNLTRRLACFCPDARVSTCILNTRKT